MPRGPVERPAAAESQTPVSTAMAHSSATRSPAALNFSKNHKIQNQLFAKATVVRWPLLPRSIRSCARVLII